MGTTDSPENSQTLVSCTYTAHISTSKFRMAAQALPVKARLANAPVLQHREGFCGNARALSGQRRVSRSQLSNKGNRVMCAVARETDPKKRVVITGMGVVSCFGNDPDVFYDKLLAGTSAVEMIDRFDTEGFPTRFAAQIKNFTSEGIIDRKNDRRLDDCLRYTITAGKKALADAGLPDDKLDDIDKSRAGILVGTGMGGLQVFQDNVKTLLNRGPKKISPFFIPYAI